jgi:hypothetical protein
MRHWRWRRIIAVGALIALVLVVVGAAWYLQPQPVLPEADAALVSGASVTVDDSNGRITFTPTDGATTGLVLYPGAKVPPKAYAVAARAIAEQGYLVVIPSMPLNLAVLGSDAALDVMNSHPEITTWAVGGHSLGGAMAGQFVANHPDKATGLVLWGAYSAADVSNTGVQWAVIYGTLDAGADKIASASSMALLPAGAAVTVIDGGNHANFGSYTGQPNDPPATIPREQQQAQAVDATVALLKSITAPDPSS